MNLEKMFQFGATGARWPRKGWRQKASGSAGPGGSEQGGDVVGNPCGPHHPRWTRSRTHGRGKSRRFKYEAAPQGFKTPCCDCGSSAKGLGGQQALCWGVLSSSSISHPNGQHLGNSETISGVQRSLKMCIGHTGHVRPSLFISV